MSGFVYAIANGHLVKIGHSSDPLSRMVKAQSDNAARLELLGAIPATVDQEAEAHELLSAHNVGGEWFDMSARPVAAFVSMLPKYETEKRASTMNALRTWRKAKKLTLEEAAPMLATSTGSLSRIERGEQWPDREFFERLPQVTGITADEMIASLAQPSSEQPEAAQ